MTLRLFAMIACATTLIACSPESKVELDDALDAINEENLKATMHYLADDARNGRRVGSPEYDDAAKYVAERIVALFDDNPDAGALGMDGAMIDRPHFVQAQRL
ncbi:MAG: hypothetical protein IIA07_13910, partial [Proteobacteria bacterium]|nr:hypothetical protein [Pseudomonadota bacterium]